MRARSPALLAMGPATARSTGSGTESEGVPGGAMPRMGTSPYVGLWANTPQKLAGTRNDPPMSLPNSRDTYPTASAAAEPPEEPPGVRPRSQGLLPGP